MRIIRAVAIIFTVCVASLAQDGGNIRYLSPKDLDRSFEGCLVHFDFGRKSFGFFDSRRDLDEVVLQVRGKDVRFREHRVDDGFNNWFRDQFLESVEPFDKKILRISHFELVEIRKNDFKTRANCVFVGTDGKPLGEGSHVEAMTIAKKDLAMVLVKSKVK